MEVEKKERDYGHYLELEGEDGSKLGLSVHSPYTHLEISGRFHHTDDKGRQIWSLPYNVKHPSIKVALTKEADVIARDVQKRIVPEYKPLLEQNLRAMEEWAQHENESDQVARRLAKVVGGLVEGTDRTDRRTVNIYRSKLLPEHLGDIEVSAGSVTFNHFSVTADEAEAILKALVAARRGK
jgi:hypothetical protein